MAWCDKKDCNKLALDRYTQCEDHVGEYLKNKQEEAKEEYWRQHDMDNYAEIHE